MDQIIFFKENQNLKDQIGSLRFSYDRPYVVHFATVYDSLSNLLHANFSGLLFYIASDFKDDDRIRLKFLTLNYPSLYICLCAQEHIAIHAWHLHMSGFLSMPINGEGIIDAYKRYIHTTKKENSELVLKIDDGILKIPLTSLLFLEASGNYTNLVLSPGNDILQTKQLGTFEYLTDQDEYFKRIHRSYILNLRRVRSISEGAVHFFNSPRTLLVSYATQVKIKKLILG